MNHNYDEHTSLYIDDPMDIDYILALLGLDKPEDLDLLDPEKLYEEYGVTIEECKKPTNELFDRMLTNFEISHTKGVVKK